MLRKSMRQISSNHRSLDLVWSGSPLLTSTHLQWQASARTKIIMTCQTLVRIYGYRCGVLDRAGNLLSFLGCCSASCLQLLLVDPDASLSVLYPPCSTLPLSCTATPRQADLTTTNDALSVYCACHLSVQRSAFSDPKRKCRESFAFLFFPPTPCPGFCLFGFGAWRFQLLECSILLLFFFFCSCSPGARE
jgi:hypothetical protein